MKIKIHTFVIILVSSITSFGQAPYWQWANGAGVNYNEKVYGIVTDISGNILVTGSFVTTITFGITTLTGASDMFVVKYDASGNVIWAHSQGGGGEDKGFDISTDASGNVYITGIYYSTSITFGTTTLTNPGGDEKIFVVKYDSSGNVLWAKSSLSSYFDESTGLSADANGNAIVAGQFESSFISFGGIPLFNAGGVDCFLVKYNTAGNVVWAKSAGGSSDDYIKGISSDSSGNVYVTGYFNSSSITFGTITLTSSNGPNMFIAKYDALGNVLWAKTATGGQGYGYGITSDLNGNVYVTGSIVGTITFGTIALTSGDPIGDIFVVKYDSSGNVLWAKRAGGTFYDFGYGISTGIAGNVYVSGGFRSTSITFGTTTLNNNGNEDGFVIKYDALGNELWATSVGGTLLDYVDDISTDVNDNVYVAGLFESPVISFGTTTLTNGGGYDVFIAKLNDITGIAPENNSLHTVIIYPNPVSNSFTFELNQDLNGTATISVLNTLGQEVFTTKNEIENGQPIDNIYINDKMKAGIYLLRIYVGNKMFVSKVIIS